MKAVMPALAAPGQILGAAERHNDVENGEARHRFAVRVGQRIGHRPTPIMAGQEEALMAKRLVHEPPDIIGDVPLVIARRRAG